MKLLSAVLIFILVLIILEFAAGLFSGIETYKIYNFSKTLGGLGAFLAFTALLFIHGFIFLKVVYQFDFSTVIVMGIFALTAITLLFVSGFFLKKKLSLKRLRIIPFFNCNNLYYILCTSYVGRLIHLNIEYCSKLSHLET